MPNEDQLRFYQEVMGVSFPEPSRPAESPPEPTRGPQPPDGYHVVSPGERYNPPLTVHDEDVVEVHGLQGRIENGVTIDIETAPLTSERLEEAGRTFVNSMRLPQGFLNGPHRFAGVDPARPTVTVPRLLVLGPNHRLSRELPLVDRCFELPYYRTQDAPSYGYSPLWGLSGVAAMYWGAVTGRLSSAPAAQDIPREGPGHSMGYTPLGRIRGLSSNFAAIDEVSFIRYYMPQDELSARVEDQDSHLKSRKTPKPIRQRAAMLTRLNDRKGRRR